MKRKAREEAAERLLVGVKRADYGPCKGPTTETSWTEKAMGVVSVIMILPTG